jgi:hypothetical protein
LHNTVAYLSRDELLELNDDPDTKLHRACRVFTIAAAHKKTGQPLYWISPLGNITRPYFADRSGYEVKKFHWRGVVGGKKFQAAKRYMGFRPGLDDLHDEAVSLAVSSYLKGLDLARHGWQLAWDEVTFKFLWYKRTRTVICKLEDLK